MNFRFEELFTVEFRHRYFGNNGLFNGIKVTPTATTQQFMFNNQLLFKELGTGFMMAYETGSSNQQQNRTALLKTESTLIFRVDLTDKNFYSYTANLPDGISNLIFHFWNYNTAEKLYRKNGLLQNDEFIGEADMNDTRLLEQMKEQVNRKMISENGNTSDSGLFEQMLIAALQEDSFKNKACCSNINLLEPYFSKPFAQISIRLNPDPAYDFAQKFILQFDSLSTYRQYILRSAHFRDLKNPAIVDKANQAVFEEPTQITLPDGQKALSIISKNSIPLTKVPQRNFRLVNDFKAADNSFKELSPPFILPDADINLISGIVGHGDDTGKKKYSTIIL